jgi:hypothetical protein
MARNPREDHVRAFYHVICRGNWRQAISRVHSNWPPRLPVRTVPLLAVVGFLGLRAICYRYDVRPIDDAEFVIIRSDRWTGNVERRIKRRGCSAF